ncbi:PD40 domain-containing protein [Cryomorphaceae bacterium]|nr:PD40 domain-containing protein [Cryomorphaceae bacterium]
MKNVFALLFCTLLLACGRGPNPVKSQGFPVDVRPHWLVYHSTDSSGVFHIWAYDLAKDSTWPLTSGADWHYHPIRWNDSILAIMGPHQGETKRLALNVRTGKKERLLEGLYDSDMLWPSPNGLMVAGQTQVNDTAQVFLARKDGKRLQWLTSGTAGGVEPSWSPDGLTLLYRSNQDGNPELYLFPLTSAYQRRLTQHDSLDRYAVWHPNGRKIAFASNRHRPGMELYLKDVATGKNRRLTDNDWEKGELSFSPDGRYLAFHARPPKGSYDLYLYDLKSDSILQLTDTPEYDGYPTWVLAK